MALHTGYKHRVYGLSANPFHHSSVISAVSGNNEVSMWDMETATRRHMLWASPLPPFSKMTDDVSKMGLNLVHAVFIILILLFSLNRDIQYVVCVWVQLMIIWSC